MDDERRAGRRKSCEFFLLRHARSASADTGQHHALRHFGYGQFAFECRGGGGKGRHAGRQRIGNAAPREPAQLFGERRVDREIAGVKPRHVEAGGVCGRELGIDLVERQRRRINDARACRAIGEQRGRHDRAGIEADRTARDEVAAAHGDQIRRARPGADEMHGHDALVAAMAASAQVAVPTDDDAVPIRSRVGPAAASAAASATEGTPISASERSELVSRARRLRPRGPLCDTSDHRNAEFFRRRFEFRPHRFSPRWWRSRQARRRVIPARASAARMAASMSGAGAPLPASDAGDDHGFVQTHCVTGIAARQPVLPPTASAREMAMRIKLAAERGVASEQQRLGFERHRIDDEPAARAQRVDRGVEHARHRSRRRR